MIRWVEDRTGLVTLGKRFLNDEIPAKTGWPQVFGSVALFLFLTQALTGILLAFNFAPTSGEAYYSLRYILSEVTGGRLVRGLHHWGASMMIVIVGVHMIQVFLYGAYKKPREATWVAGVGLLLLTLAYGLTGYLLPWDNRAYWGTVVATRIASQVPVAGSYLARILGLENGIGAATYAHFYSIHVLLLPPATTLLIALHVFLVRRHGVTVPEDDGVRVKFYPRQAFKDTVAIFGCFAALFLLAAAVDVPLGKIADPTDTTYMPRPDWYFLFLFQALKLFPGPLEVVASTILPGLAMLALLLVPFLDRGRVRRVTERTAAAGIATLALAGWAALTVAALTGTPAPSASVESREHPSWQMARPEAVAAGKLANVPAAIVEGARLYVASSCATCHIANGSGAQVGPKLNGLAKRRTRDWVIRHFRDPKSVSPGSMMPPYKFTEPQMERITTYVMSLP